MTSLDRFQLRGKITSKPSADKQNPTKRTYPQNHQSNLFLISYPIRRNIFLGGSGKRILRSKRLETTGGNTRQGLSKLSPPKPREHSKPTDMDDKFTAFWTDYTAYTNNGEGITLDRLLKRHNISSIEFADHLATPEGSKAHTRARSLILARHEMALMNQIQRITGGGCALQSITGGEKHALDACVNILRTMAAQPLGLVKPGTTINNNVDNRKVSFHEALAVADVDGEVIPIGPPERT